MPPAPAPWQNDPTDQQPATAANDTAPWASDPVVGNTPAQPAAHRYQVKTPTGKTYEFDAPADATPEQLDALSRKAAGYGDKYPVVAPEQPGFGETLLENTKNDVAGIVQGAAALPDMAASGVGKLLSAIPNAIGHALSAAGHEDAAKWIQDNITHHLANPVQVGDVVEKVAPTPDTTAGHVNRFVGNMVGGAMTVPASAVESTVARVVGDAPKAVVSAADATKAAAASDTAQTAKAAQDLNIDLPAFSVKGPAAQAQAAKLTRRGGFGASELGQSAQNAIDQAQAARDTTAKALAEPRELDSNLGDQIKTAATDARTEDRARIGRMFDAGDAQMADTPIALNQTKQALDNLVEEDSKALVPGPVSSLVKQMQQRIADSGGTTNAANLRASIQNLKAQMRANMVDATTSDHIISTLRDAMNGDMETAARQSGNDAALQTYQDAREQWAASKTLDKTVLKPILGAAFQNNGDQVVNELKNAVENNGTRVAQLFGAIPEDVANTARASLISRMGTDKSGAFNLAQLFDNWNSLGGSRNLIFPRETVEAMDKLAQVAKLGKPLQTVAQNGAKAGSYSLKKLMTTGPAVLGEAAAMFTHDVKDIALGTLGSGLAALGQWRTAKLLSSPELAKKIAATPMNAKGAVAYWNRPWVTAMANKNPMIAGEILALQKAIVANEPQSVVSSAAASTDANQQNQNQ